VITGDFFQLPPAMKTFKYAFEAKFWKQAIPNTFNLTQIFRQRDQEFINMLNAVRYGMLTYAYIDILQQRCSAPVEYDDDVEPTELYPVRWAVEAANKERLGRLNTVLYTFTAFDFGPDYLLNKVLAEPILHLGVGAQVRRTQVFFLR
ncbi:hypothetical protein B0H13DRAFT_1637197, partial [Mycena leptocephala]